MLTKKTTLLLLRILEKIAADKSLHSRWLNTLSYLEYIGTRKILKSLPAHVLSRTFLEHINEEARHSLFFKKLAQKISQKNLSFKEHELIASQSVGDYFQQVDHFSLKFSFSNPFISYLYTTYMVEQRAMAVYPVYNEVLKRKGFPFSLQGILKEEKEHLDFVFKKVQNADPLWEKNLEEFSHFEHQKYFSLLIALEREVFDMPLMPRLHQLKRKSLPAAPYHQKL